MSRARFAASVLVVLSILAGCPRRFDPVASPNLKSPDAEANRLFAEARQLFDAGSLAKADEAFGRLLAATRPDDPLVPLGLVYRGRIALRQGDPRRARQLLEGPAGRPAEDEVGIHARYHLGLAAVRAGDHAEGRRLLTPFLGTLPKEKLPPVLAGLAQACLGLRDYPAAAGHLSRLHEETDRDAEKAHARASLEDVISARMTEEQVRRLYPTVDSKSLAAALAARRLAAAAVAAGNRVEAARLLRETAGARAAHRVPGSDPTVEIRPDLVGLLVPLDGPYRVAGQQLLAGAMEGALAFQPPAPGRITLLVRDGGSGAAAAARDLLETRGVIALAGTLGPSESSAVAEVAARHGAPFITLSGGDADAPGPATTYRVFPTNRARAEALARHAVVALGLKRLLVLSPQTPYGDAMGRVFTDAVAALGATALPRLAYPKGAASFAQQASRIRKTRFDGLFVPDAAPTVALIAPALSKVGLWPSAAGASGPGQRAYRLLATAEGLSAAALAPASRYLEGAILAPGFCTDDEHPSVASITARFRAAQGRSPSLLDAFAHDAVAAVRARIEGGARDRTRLAELLRSPDGAPIGLTGPLRFGAGGARSDRPLLYQVRDGKAVRLP